MVAHRYDVRRWGADQLLRLTPVSPRSGHLMLAPPGWAEL